jgi:predicted amidohydrolase YtcJ
MRKRYENGTILTMEKDVPCAEALLTDGDRIAAVGTRDALAEAAPDAEPVDLGGAVLLPGFIDAHSHFSQVAGGMLQVSLEGADSVAEIGRRIRTFCRDNALPQDTFVIARDYDNNLLPDAKNPGLEAFDSFAEGRPLIVQHKSGHMGLFNSAAMAALGITADTRAPEGGRIGQENGRLTGYLEENAYFTYLKKAPMPGIEKLLEAYGKAQQLYASYGITTMQEGMFVEQMTPMYRALLDQKMLRLDLVAYPDIASLESVQRAFGEYAKGYRDHFRLGGMKIFLDGSPQGRTAWMRTPYAGQGEYRGYGTQGDGAVYNAMETAARKNLQLLAHCNGDAAAAQFLRCLARCEENHPNMKELRPVMIHAQLLGLDQIAEAAALGMTASFFVAHVYHWGEVHIRNFGAARAAEISPAAAALKAGLPFTFHQDAPVIQPDMLETVWCAVNRRTKCGVQLGPEQAISPWEALRAVTATAAWQYFEDDIKGTLTPGKLADFVILGENPLTVPPEEIRTIPVLSTIKGGETVYTA